MLEILGVRIVSQHELGFLLQIIRHVWSRPLLSKDLAHKMQGTYPLG